MYIKIIPDDFDTTVYNQHAFHPMQSWEWGEARKQMGTEILRIAQYEKETLHSVYQITFHKIPYVPFTIGYLPRSICPPEEILRFLEREGKRRKCIFIKIEPYGKKLEISWGANRIPPLGWGLDLRTSPHPLFPTWTIMLDLTSSEDELLRKMHPKTRYNIKLAQKKGVVIKEMTNDRGFEIFAKLYFETCKRQRYHGHNHAYHKIIFESLKNTTAHILVAFYNNEPLAAYEVFLFKDVLYYPYGGSSLAHRSLMAPNLLMWEVIRFGKQSGAKKFDMWGSLPPTYDVENPWTGFTRFKQGFGGEFVEMVGSFDLIVHPTLYTLYNILHNLRSFFLRFS